MYSEGPYEQKPIKNLGENGAWAYTGTAQIFWVPSIISDTDKATNFKFGRYIHRVHPNKSALKIWEKMERGRIEGLPKIFWVPPIISGTDKATNFKYCTHILSIDRNKSPLQISGKVAGAFARTLETFQGTHILGASRGRLCDSKAFLWKKICEWSNQYVVKFFTLLFVKNADLLWDVTSEQIAFWYTAVFCCAVWTLSEHSRV